MQERRGVGLSNTPGGRMDAGQLDGWMGWKRVNEVWILTLSRISLKTDNK